MKRDLDQTVISQFQENGVAVLRDIFTDWVNTLREGVDKNMDEPGPFGKIYQSENGAGRFLSDYCNWQRIPQYGDFILNSPAASIGAQLMSSEKVQLFHEHVLVKEADTDIKTPWHQDLPYYCVDGPKTLSMWIPLDKVPADRCPEFVAGSHKWGKYFRPKRFNGQALNQEDGLEEIPDIDNARSDYDICSWNLELGDAIAFDYRTVHGAPANTSASEQRRAFSLRLVGDGVHFVRRAEIVTSPPFPEVNLNHGDMLTGETFPILLGEASIS